jgi:hypothetical protein
VGKNFGVADHIIDVTVFVGLMGGFVNPGPAGGFIAGPAEQGGYGAAADTARLGVHFIDILDGRAEGGDDGRLGRSRGGRRSPLLVLDSDLDLKFVFDVLDDPPDLPIDIVK